MKVGIITIGDELLIGQVIDSNSARIAQWLSELSISVERKWTVGDQATSILQVLQEAFDCCDIVITTGGLGPTKDDITKKVIADYFNVGLEFSEVNYQHLVNILHARNIIIQEAHKTQCYIPSNASLLDNQIGTALGMWIEHNDKILISLPGVPDEMNYIMEHAVVPKFKLLPTSWKVLHKTFMTVGKGETDIAGRIEPLLTQMPEYLSLAYLPSVSQVKLRLTGRHSQEKLLIESLTVYSDIIKKELSDIIFGEGDTNLALELGKKLIQKKWTLATIESCTGGSIASKFTANPGSSAFFKGGIVSYATEVKENLLGIPHESIEDNGVVSEEVARAMVINGANLMKADCVIATTGIAGPDGATENLPIGTVYIACGNAKSQQIKRLRLGKNRQRTIEASSVLAMNLLREWIIENE